MRTKTKAAPAKRARSTKTTHKKRPTVRARPLHKRILLHPFSVMVLLCAGVLIIGSTLTGYAADYDVTAIVPAQLPSGPAVVTDPIDGLHVTAQPVTVSGTCPAYSFVKLYRNNAFSGVAQCSGSLTFQIQTSLSVGANVLDPKVFNFTDQEGPAGAPVTLYYDDIVLPPSPGPAGGAPTTLTIATLEQNNYENGGVETASINPTITGYAPPYSSITLTFHSDVVYCRTKADRTGFWSCTLDAILPIGVHSVDIAAVTPAGKRLAFPSFQLRVIRGIPSLKKPALPSPFVIVGGYLYTTKQVNQAFNFELAAKGGAGPYQITVDWGDGIEAGLTHNEQTAFTVSHAYTTPGQYVVLVRGTDGGKQTALLQLSAVVRGSSTLVGGAGWISRMLSGIKQWLWLVWPVYIGVLLMVLSYWIGEQEAYRELVVRRRVAHSGKGKR